MKKNTFATRLFTMCLASGLLAAGLAHAQTAPPTTAPEADVTPLAEGLNRVAVPDSGDTMVLKVQRDKVVEVSVIAKGSSEAVPFNTTRPIGAACFKPYKQVCYADNVAGPKKIICYCEGNGPARIKGAPMTLVNNTNSNGPN